MQSNNKYLLGYLTGTFDTFHEAHLTFLQNAKKLCHTLIVGVTTDDVAKRQKRRTLQSFKTRLAVVRGCECVTIAIPHKGFSKQHDYERLHPDVIISMEEYYDSEEFRDFGFPDNNPCPVIFLPRNDDISSTDILSRAFLHASILSYGVNGAIFKCGNKVIKEVKIGSREVGNTADVYQLGWPRPRNWKKVGAIHDNPNYPGVNVNRELQVLEVLRKYPWFLSEQVIVKYNNPCDTANPSVHKERHHPQQIVWLVQRYGGQTLSALLPDITDYHYENISAQLKEIFKDLFQAGVVHGDVHPDNICVDSNGVVSLVDFGWCMHSSFEMSAKEQVEYTEHLETGFDAQHYLNSLGWIQHLKNQSKTSSI